MKIEITEKERIVIERLLNTFIDSDYFVDGVPKGIKNADEANEAMKSLEKKVRK